MNTKLISERALSIADQYKNFKFGNAVCSIPYFNNKNKSRRAGLRVEVGKGSPKEIFEELNDLIILNKIKSEDFNGESLKKFMVDNGIGIDCSGFAYYLLNEESLSRNKGSLDRHLHFVGHKNFISNFIAKFRPAINSDVNVFAHNKNSRIVPIKDIQVGDFITMVGSTDDKIRNHILVITQIEYQNFLPITLHYTHAIAWPTDGEYNHGIHEGKIDIINNEKSIIDQRWIELEKEGEENYTYKRAKTSLTEVRRLNWF